MKSILPFVAAGLLLGCFPKTLDAQANSLSEAGWREDVAILEQALLELHPGTLRTLDRDEFEAGLAALRNLDVEQREIEGLYLELSRFLTSIRCGHTYANYWNQADSIKQQVLEGSNKVPFLFDLVGGRMLVTESASPRLPKSAEILSIDGVSVSAIVAELSRFVKTDGSNEEQRVFDLQLTGQGDYESFDVFFPLLFPPSAEGYELVVRNLENSAESSVVVGTMSRSDRSERLQGSAQGGETEPGSLWQLTYPSANTALLRMPTFVVWKGDFQWSNFLKESFAELAERKVEHLIVDIRGNGGGLTDVTAALLRYLLQSEITVPPLREVLRYEKVPADLAPYVDTWDPSFMDRSGKVKPLGNDLLTWKWASDKPRTIKPSQAAFAGKVWLLVDAANSSATFYLAKRLKAAGDATLVGEPTGGNLRGITAGQILFLRLPNSKLEVDVPAVGSYPAGEPPDRGLTPDVLVERTVEDVVAGRDQAFERVLELIAETSPR